MFCSNKFGSPISLFFIVLSSRVFPKPEKPSITEKVIVEKQLLLKVIREFKEFKEFKDSPIILIIPIIP